MLVVRTDHVGDLICSTPFLRTLREHCPKASITACVSSAATGVLHGSNAIDRVVTKLDGIERPDLAIALAPRTRTYRMVSRTRAPLRAGYVYPERPLVRLMSRWWLSHRVPMEVRSHLASGRVPHEVEQLSHFGRALGLAVGEPRLELPVDEADLQWGRGEAAGRVAVHLSAGWLTHGWTLDDFVALCRALPDVLVTYGPAEAALASVLKGSGLALYGGLSLKRWAALLGGCSCVVSPDTGAVHVAASQGRPVVVCYQSEHFKLCSQQWFPWGVSHRNVSKERPEATRAELVEAVAALRPAGMAGGGPPKG